MSFHDLIQLIGGRESYVFLVASMPPVAVISFLVFDAMVRRHARRRTQSWFREHRRQRMIGIDRDRADPPSSQVTIHRAADCDARAAHRRAA